MPPNFLTRILCVDDDEDSREVLCALLSFAQIEAKASLPQLLLCL